MCIEIVSQYSVVIPVFNNFKIARECLTNVLKNTPSDTQILVIDDASTEGFFSDYNIEVTNQLTIIRNESNLGFVEACNKAFELTIPSDVILVNSDVMVTKNWSERLNEDAYRFDHIATVTAMADRGGIASIKFGHKSLEGSDFAEIENLNEYLSSLESLPPAVIPVGVGHCLYIKRQVLSRIGYFSEEFSPGYGEEVDFSIRAANAGYIHTLSESVIVRHLEGLSFGSRRDELIARHEILLRQKYPDFDNYLASYQENFKTVEEVFLRAISWNHGI